jgi:cell division protein FtsW
LTLVFVPGLGRKINGAYRWVELGPLRFQPSELAKIATILSLAAYAAFYQRQMGRFKIGLLFPGLGLLAVLVLIFAGRDYGTTMLLAAVSFMMLVVAGAKIRYVMPFLLIGVLALGYMMWHNPTRRDRLMAWFHPEQYLDGTGYQAYQAKIALGSGGVDGLGLGNGRQKLGFVPEHHTDFIFSIIGEELGLVATMGVVLAFITIVICGTLIAWRARDPFGVYLASGITFLIGLQAFINIGVVTSVLPNKGLPLPFISYGGSNLLLMLFSMGLLLSVARQANEPVPMPDDPFAPETANVS